MSENQQSVQSNCNCRFEIDQGTSDSTFRCSRCLNEHLLECFQSIYESIDDTVYIETECRSCILQIFHERVQRERQLDPQYLILGTPTPVESEDELSIESVEETGRPAPIQPTVEQSSDDISPTNVELEKCVRCSREIWYLSVSEWQVLRETFPEDYGEEVLCSDCDEDTSEEELLEREQFIREIHEL